MKDEKLTCILMVILIVSVLMLINACKEKGIFDSDDELEEGFTVKALYVTSDELGPNWELYGSEQHIHRKSVNTTIGDDVYDIRSTMDSRFFEFENRPYYGNRSNVVAHLSVSIAQFVSEDDAEKVFGDSRPLIDEPEVGLMMRLRDETEVAGEEFGLHYVKLADVDEIHAGSEDIGDGALGFSGKVFWDNFSNTNVTCAKVMYVREGCFIMKFVYVSFAGTSNDFDIVPDIAEMLVEKIRVGDDESGC